MIKIVGIMGSPRRNGNTHILMDRILEGAKDAGADTELVIIADLDIAPCDGCYVCYEKKPCNKEDDMNILYDTILEADVIIFGTPLYWYGPTAIMKAFLDRLQYFTAPENLPLVRGKKAVTATVYEEDGITPAVPLLLMYERGFAYFGLELVDTILVPGVLDKGAIKEKTEDLEKAYQLGKSLAR